MPLTFGNIQGAGPVGGGLHSPSIFFSQRDKTLYFFFEKGQIYMIDAGWAESNGKLIFRILFFEIWPICPEVEFSTGEIYRY